MGKHQKWYSGSQEVMRYRKRQVDKKWMTNEILDMMEQRRLANGNPPKYKEIHRKIRGVQNVWLAELCREAEELHKEHDAFQFPCRI